MLNTPPLCLQHPSPCSHTSESRPQSHWTARHNYWVTDASLWLSLTPLNENISCHINKQEISPPSVISGLQMWMRAPQTAIQGVWPPPPMVIAEGLGECKKQEEQGNTIGPRQLRSRERSGGSDPEAAPPHTQNAKFLNLILDLWWADCLLPVLQTCI